MLLFKEVITRKACVCSPHMQIFIIFSIPFVKAVTEETTDAEGWLSPVRVRTILICCCQICSRVAWLSAHQGATEKFLCYTQPRKGPWRDHYSGWADGISRLWEAIVELCKGDQTLLTKGCCSRLPSCVSHPQPHTFRPRSLWESCSVLFSPKKARKSSKGRMGPIFPANCEGPAGITTPSCLPGTHFSENATRSDDRILTGSTVPHSGPSWAPHYGDPILKETAGNLGQRTGWEIRSLSRKQTPEPVSTWTACPQQEILDLKVRKEPTKESSALSFSRQEPVVVCLLFWDALVL